MLSSFDRLRLWQAEGDCHAPLQGDSRLYPYGYNHIPLLYSGPSSLTTVLALEEYFCRSLGFTLLALGILTVLLTGSVPLTSTFADGITTVHPIPVATPLYDTN